MQRPCQVPKFLPCFSSHLPWLPGVRWWDRFRWWWLWLRSSAGPGRSPCPRPRILPPLPPCQQSWHLWHAWCHRWGTLCSHKGYQTCSEGENRAVSEQTKATWVKFPLRKKMDLCASTTRVKYFNHHDKARTRQPGLMFLFIHFQSIGFYQTQASTGWEAFPKDIVSTDQGLDLLKTC